MRSDFYIDFNYRCHIGRCSSIDKVTVIIHGAFHTPLYLPTFAMPASRQWSGRRREKKEKKIFASIPFLSEIRMITFFQEAMCNIGRERERER